MLPIVAFFVLFLIPMVAGLLIELFGAKLSERKSNIILASSICIGALVASGIFLWYYYEEQYPFPQEKTTTAVLTRKYWSPSRYTINHEVTVYEYKVEDIKHEGQFRKDNLAIEMYEFGDSIDVTYDPNRPINSIPSYLLYHKYIRPEMEMYLLKIQRGEGRRVYAN